MAVLSSASVPIYYEVMGAGFPLVAINGFTFNLRMWDQQRGSLAVKYQMITFDLRGHGKSAAPDYGYTTEDYLKDLEGLLNYLRIDNMCLMGHSTGANLAVEYTLQHSETVKALILADPIIDGMLSCAGWNEAYRKFRTRTMEEGLQAGLEKEWFNNPIFDSCKNDRCRFMFVKDVVRSFSGKPLLAMESFSTIHRSAERVSRIACPCLILYGDQNLEECIAISDSLSERIPHATKVALPGSGHLSNVQNPSGFTEAILHFLSDIPLDD